MIQPSLLRSKGSCIPVGYDLVLGHSGVVAGCMVRYDELCATGDVVHSTKGVIMMMMGGLENVSIEQRILACLGIRTQT